jgi:hypothetical protein
MEGVEGQGHRQDAGGHPVGQQGDGRGVHEAAEV